MASAQLWIPLSGHVPDESAGCDGFDGQMVLDTGFQTCQKEHCIHLPCIQIRAVLKKSIYFKISPENICVEESRVPMFNKKNPTTSVYKDIDCAYESTKIVHPYSEKTV